MVTPTMMIARTLCGHVRLLSLTTRQSTCFHHLHQQSISIHTNHQLSRTKTLLANHSVVRFDTTLNNIKQQTVRIDNQILFSQIRLINIAGEESLEFARKTRKAQKRQKRRDEEPNPSKRRSPFGYLFVLLPIATFVLGTWQIYRLQWKLDLIDKLENLVKSTPVEFPENLTNLQEREYLKVRVNGYFDLNAEPVFIFPRPVVKESTSKSSQQDGSGLFSTSKSHNIGAQMIMPFVVTESRLIEAYNQLLIESGREEILADKKQFRILVNVGWVSRETMEKVNRSIGSGLAVKSRLEANSQPDIELIGVIRKTEKREPFAKKKDVGHGYTGRRDIVKIASQLDTTPIYLDAHESYRIALNYYPDTIQPVGAQTRVNMRNEHLSYIITWYSLTGIFSYLWFKKIFRARL